MVSTSNLGGDWKKELPLGGRGLKDGVAGASPRKLDRVNDGKAMLASAFTPPAPPALIGPTASGPSARSGRSVSSQPLELNSWR